MAIQYPRNNALGANPQAFPKTQYDKIVEIIDHVNEIEAGTVDLVEVVVEAGTAAAPSVTTTGDEDTGIYFPAANQVGVTAGGTGQVKFTDGTIEPITDNDVDLGSSSKEFKNVYVQGVITQTNTTASTTKDTGAIITDGGIGVEKEIYAGLSINAGTYLTSGNGTVSLPAIGPVSDPDSGLYVIGANNLGMALNGAKVLDMATTGLGVTGVVNVTSASATSLAVGRLGATTPAFTVDSSTGTQVAGLKVTGAATGGTVAIVATDSGADTNVTLNAKGTGTIGIGSVSTGAVTITPATTVTGAITPTGGVAAAGGFSVSPRNCAIGGLVPAVSTDFTDATPVNTETYIGEVFVPANCTVTGIAIFNGSNVTDNIIVALADSTGAIVAQSISTAGSGADAYQLVPFTAPYEAKGPATYYILSQYAGSTSRYNAPPLGVFGASKKTGEVFGTFTTITPPTTFTTNLCNIASLY